MGLERVIETIKEQEWIDTPASKLQKLVRDIYDSLEPNASRSIRNLLHGTWFKHPVHAALSDVPIGAWTAALLLDTIEPGDKRHGMGAAADLLVAAGVVSATGAALAGITDWYQLRGKATRRIGAFHAGLNGTDTLLYGTSLLLRANGWRGAGKLLSVLGYGVVMSGAWLGGDLVFRERVGIDHTSELKPPREFTPVLPDAELPEGELRRVMVDEVPILLYRDGPRIYALVEKCAHMGGPLAKGHVQDGTAVCPWHGSRFDLASGQVVEGPSAHAQPSFETRVQNGQIEVRLQPAA